MTSPFFDGRRYDSLGGYEIVTLDIAGADALAPAVVVVDLKACDPSLYRVEADPRCDRCGHRDELHGSDGCLYHDSEGPCLCGSRYEPEPWEEE